MEVVRKQKGHLYAKVYVNKAKLRVVLSPSVKRIDDLHLDGKHNKYFFRILTSTMSVEMHSQIISRQHISRNARLSHFLIPFHTRTGLLLNMQHTNCIMYNTRLRKVDSLKPSGKNKVKYRSWKM